MQTGAVSCTRDRPGKRTAHDRKKHWDNRSRHNIRGMTELSCAKKWPAPSRKQRIERGRLDMKFRPRNGRESQTNSQSETSEPFYANWPALNGSIRPDPRVISLSGFCNGTPNLMFERQRRR